jgi:hypothetical protein
MMPMLGMAGSYNLTTTLYSGTRGVPPCHSRCGRTGGAHSVSSSLSCLFLLASTTVSCTRSMPMSARSRASLVPALRLSDRRADSQVTADT